MWKPKQITTLAFVATICIQSTVHSQNPGHSQNFGQNSEQASGSVNFRWQDLPPTQRKSSTAQVFSWSAVNKGLDEAKTSRHNVARNSDRHQSVSTTAYPATGDFPTLATATEELQEVFVASANEDLSAIPTEHQVEQVQQAADLGQTAGVDTTAGSDSWGLASTSEANVLTLEKAQFRQGEPNASNPSEWLGPSVGAVDYAATQENVPSAEEIQVAPPTGSFQPSAPDPVVYQFNDLDQSAGVSQTGDAASPSSAGLQLQAVKPQNVSSSVETPTLAEMRAPLPSATKLFSELGISEKFRDQVLAPGSQVRGYADDPQFNNLVWPNQTFTWVTAAFHHQPLYFEQVNLERYGYGPRPCFKPILSSAHFFGSLALMPYKLTTQHPCEHVYTLGHQRPGDCVRYQRRSLLGQSYPGEALAYCYDIDGYR